MPIDTIKTADIETWLKSMDCAPKTRQHRKALLHSIFNAAIRWEFATSNPVGLARVKGASKRRRRPALITVEQFRTILEVLPEPYRQMVMLAGFLGLRASEVMPLKWSDFDLDAGALMVERSSVSARVEDTKTEASQDCVALDAALVNAMLAWKERCPDAEEGWVFPSPVTGGPFHQDTIRSNHLHPAGVAVGLPSPWAGTRSATRIGGGWMRRERPWASSKS